MKNDKSNKGKHLSLEDRYYIEEALNQKCSLKEIAKILGKDATTISKEIRRNRIVSCRTKQADYISCTNKKDCTKRHICDKACDQLCKKCKILNCYRSCSDYASATCSSLKQFPHVCNGCKRKLYAI